MSVRLLSALDSSVGFYFAGITDGEGHFAIKRNKRGWSCVFILKLRADDLPLLEWLCEETGLGRIEIVYFTQGCCTLLRMATIYTTQDQALDWVEHHWGDLICEVCGKDGWGVSGLVGIPLIHLGNVALRVVTPLFPVSCTTCGNTKFLNEDFVRGLRESQDAS